MDGTERKILAAEDLVLYKGLSARPKDREAIQALKAAQDLDMEYIREWADYLGNSAQVREALEGRPAD